MRLVLDRKEKDIIPVSDMKDGDLAEITAWGTHDKYIGLIVQRYGDSLVIIGQAEDKGWFNLFKRLDVFHSYFSVRPLKSGETIKIVG